MIESRNGQSQFECVPAHSTDNEVITLAYGEGGRLSRKFIRERIVSRFGQGNGQFSLSDAAVIPQPDGRIAFTTDGYTVSPLFFPGGDIGTLCVFGTVNDLAVTGAIPQWLSLSMVIEEGLPWTVVDSVLDSIQAAADRAEVKVITGDTKVVPRGAVDSLFITTSGLGLLVPEPPPGPQAIRDGDLLIVSGPIGQHGAAVLCARDQIDFDPLPDSDCAPLNAPIIELCRTGLVPRSIRDATRGGVAAVLHEWADDCNLTFTLEESKIPIRDGVRSVCELLGLDPLHLANEGTFVLATQSERADETIRTLRRFDVSREAAVVGRVAARRSSPVSVIRSLGREVGLTEPAGAPLPRIC